MPSRKRTVGLEGLKPVCPHPHSQLKPLSPTKAGKMRMKTGPRCLTPEKPFIDFSAARRTAPYSRQKRNGPYGMIKQALIYMIKPVLRLAS